MVAYSIKGDFFDCQLYAGNLFLWTYSGELKIYNFNKLLSRIVEMGGDGINDNMLFECQVGLVERKTVRFPSDSEIYDGIYYVTTRNGLYQSSLKDLEQGFKKVWDCSLFSISAQRKKGLTMAGGAEGVFIYSEVYAIREKYGMREKDIVQVSKDHANYSAFCKQGLYATSVLEKSYYLKFPKYGYEGHIISIDDIFPKDHVSLSWSYRDRIYAYIDDKIKIKRIKKVKEKIVFVDEAEYLFFPQKGKVLSGISTDFADVIELEHALVIVPTNRDADTPGETIFEPITRWRAYPKSLGYRNIIMVILEDELKIYVLDRQYRSIVNTNRRINRLR